MKVIQLLKDRIKNFEYQQHQLNKERDDVIERLQRICAHITNHQNEINEMQISIEILEKAE